MYAKEAEVSRSNWLKPMVNRLSPREVREFEKRIQTICALTAVRSKKEALAQALEFSELVVKEIDKDPIKNPKIIAERNDGKRMRFYMDNLGKIIPYKRRKFK